MMISPSSLILALLCFSLPTHAADKIRVSTFSSVLTEVAEKIGGDRVAVRGHVKGGVDPHEYEPTPGDLKVVGQSQLILLSAKHLEGYVGKLKQSTGTKGVFLEVGNGFESLRMVDEHHHHDHGSGNAEDPHWWHSMDCMVKASRIVRDALIALSPADKDYFNANCAGYELGLSLLAKWVKSEVAKLPRNRRTLVTSHDAFQYFAKEHGFKIHAIEGISSADKPSSKKVAQIIELIKAQGVKAIFPESIENPKVLQEITRETGAKLGPILYADGLGEAGGKAGTFEGMYRHNVTSIVEALR